MAVARLGRAALDQWHRTGRRGAGQAHFVEHLADAGASGLAIGLGMSGPPLTAATAPSADQLALPLLTVPFSVPFTAVVRAVAAAIDRAEASQLGASPGCMNCCGAPWPRATGGPEMFRKIGDELGVRLYLVDPATGKSPFDDQAESAYAAAWRLTLRPRATPSRECSGCGCQGRADRGERLRRCCDP